MYKILQEYLYGKKAVEKTNKEWKELADILRFSSYKY